MPQNPEMRASDRDRDQYAEILRENYAQGRLTQEELNERLDAVYETRTMGGLQQLTADLPAQDLYDLPLPAAKDSVPAVRVPGELQRPSQSLRASWAAWGTVNMVTLSVWLIVCLANGELLFPWFLWVAGPWGAVLLAKTLFGTPGSHDG
ncbi:DUF1707 domain-containing protein [Actinocorallia sp. B10E7]|uniref:DUF1707 SHOCT-like domain-containing protein n=1 Tax=Actinocorallia sp. B10E7 TaxID=3153558 RepID=UPI00325CEDD1